ncbi:DUF7504 family protein [Halorussus salinisoli]|uniref:DUF7504 family protein n=1 Tax=Halorussus salinisoli TaxID=2558242 RepID=UPI0010C1E813|nr:hypothetical protein [Halorussus salinisoli]
MGSYEEQIRSNDDREQQFATKLSLLKERGSALLVVGNLPVDAYQTACRWMLGDEAVGPRRRILVVTDNQSPTVESRLPKNADASNLKVVSSTPNTRAAATNIVDNSQIDSKIEQSYIDLTNLGKLGSTVSEMITEFNNEVDELDPAELRLCFDSLRPVLTEHSTSKVFKFVDLLASRVRKENGMSHFHLPLARNNETVRTFAPLFDAVIQLHEHDGQIEQRWELCESGLSSNWLPL